MNFNENVLPNETFWSQVFQGRLPRRQLGSGWIVVLTAKTRSYVDGCEHYDVVDYRKKFLRRMVALWFLNAPTESAKVRSFSRPPMFPKSSHCLNCHYVLW